LEEIKNRFGEAKAKLDKSLAEADISQYTYDIELSKLQLDQDKALIEKQKSITITKIGQSRMTDLDKTRSLTQAEENYTTALQKATAAKEARDAKAFSKLTEPITKAIRDENIALVENASRIAALREGRLQLTATEEAELLVREKAKEYDDKDREVARAKLDELRQVIAARIENNRLLEHETTLANLRNQIQFTGAGFRAGFLGEAGAAYESALQSGRSEQQALDAAKLTEHLTLLKMQADSTRQSIEGIGSAFATTMFDGTIALAEGSKTTKEVFADLVKSLAQMLMNAAKQMIATYIAIGIARMFAGMGASNAGSQAAPQVDIPAYGPPTLGGAPMYANGGIAPGGFKAFAAGGIVTGPTLGLVGEGRYNEAIIPMPNGKAVPVDLQGSAGGATNVVVNVDAKGTQAQGNDANATALGRMLANAVQEEIMRQKRPGGLLA
jgi:hypothetical protein